MPPLTLPVSLALMFAVVLVAVPAQATHTATPCTGVFVAYEDGHQEQQQFCNIGEDEPWLDLPPPGPEWVGSLHVPYIQVVCATAGDPGFGPASDLDGHVPRYWEIHVFVPPAETVICSSQRPAPTCGELAPRARLEPDGTVRLSADPQHAAVGLAVYRGSGDDIDFVSALDPANPFYADAPPEAAGQYTFRAYVIGAPQILCTVDVQEIPAFGSALGAVLAAAVAAFSYVGLRRR